MSESLQPHELQHARPPCPSPTPGACSNSCPLSWWCHPTISSSVVPFSSRLQSFPASGSFPMSQFFTEKAMATYSSTLAWNIPRTEEPGRLQSMGSLSQTWLSDFTFTFHFHALEKEMKTHSSILAWRIPRMGEPGGLLSMGSHRVGHNLSDLAAAAAAAVLHIRRPKYWNFSFTISPSNEYSGLISFRMDWLDLLAVQGTPRSLFQHHSSKALVLQHSAFFIVQLSYPYMTTRKTIALTTSTFVGKVMSLFFNMLSRLVITFLPRSKHLLISSAVILEPQKIMSVAVSI